MRSQLSDQDLTDYALNELGPEERLYVESMLAVSEECRNDVYETIDMAMLIEESFERQDARAATLELTPDQRAALLNVQMPSRVLRRSAAVLAAAAAVALAFVTKDAWLPKGAMPHVKQTASNVSVYVQQAAVEGEDFVNQLQSFRRLTGDSAKWLPQQPAGASVFFGPPSSLNSEVAPMSPMELTP